MNPETPVCVTELNLWRVVISSRIVRASSAGTCEDDPESGGRYSLPIAKQGGIRQKVRRPWNVVEKLPDWQKSVPGN
jgi:hypothetical protein